MTVKSFLATSNRSDPTYNQNEIRANPAWELAFTMSEIDNDNAPSGWGKYLGLAECLLANYEIKRKGAR